MKDKIPICNKSVYIKTTLGHQEIKSLFSYLALRLVIDNTLLNKC